MDGGANCHVLVREEHFLILCKKNISCTLANGEKSGFQGIGIAVVETEPGNYVILAPAYLSKKDDVNTISPGALKCYSKCIEAKHEALEYFQLTTSNKKSYKLSVETVAGLDYVKLGVHHFKRPMQTKMQRNPHLTVQPKFIFRSGIQPIKHDSIEDDNENQVQDSSAKLATAQSSTSKAQVSRGELKQTSQLSSLDAKSFKTLSDCIAKKNGEQPVSSRTRSKLRALNIEPILSKYEASELYCTEDPNVAAMKMKSMDQRTAMYLHIKFGHQHNNYIQETAKSHHIKGLPKNIANLIYDCPICRIASAPKLPRGSLKDTTELRKGSRFHADWIIMNTLSCRQFRTAFLITEARTRRKFGFVTRSRSAPIEIMKYFVGHMRRLGYTVDELRVDEDGSLARSANFMKVCTKELNIVVQSTGGYNSENNGMAESPIKPIKHMIRAMLIEAALPDGLWCYAFTYTVYLSNH